MPQMKPMIWTMMMLLTLLMITLTIMINFFSTSNNINYLKSKKIKSMNWKW